MANVYVVLSVKARQAAIARTGADPGRLAILDMTAATAEERATIGSAVEVMEVKNYNYGDWHDDLPKGSVAVVNVGADDSTPAAVATAIEAKRQSAEQYRATRRATWETQAQNYLANSEARFPERFGDAEREAVPDNDPLVLEVERVQAERKAQWEAEKRKERDEWIEQFFSDPAARASIFDGPLYTLRSINHPRADEVSREAARRDKADEEAKRQADRAKAAQDRERRLLKLAFLQSWVLAHGTADMRQRAEARLDVDEDDQDAKDYMTLLGVLPEDEVIEAIREATFAGIPRRPYDRINAKDMDESTPRGEDENDEEDGYPFHHTKGDFSVEVTDETQFTAGQWATLQAIKAKAPEGATVTLRRHEATCTTRQCSATHSVIRHGVLVKVTVAPGLDLHREYNA